MYKPLAPLICWRVAPASDSGACSMLRWLWLVCLIGLQGCTTVFFQPSRDMIRTPADLNLSYDTITLTTRDDHRLHLWQLNAVKPVKGYVIFLHGNGKNLSYHLPAVSWLPEQGYAVLMLDYRGYGLSEGNASVALTMMDLDRMFNWYRRHSDRKPLFMIGQSLGGTLATHWLSQHPDAAAQVSGLVLDAPFASYPGMAQQWLAQRWLTWPVQWLGHFFPRRYDPLKHKALTSIPVLFFHNPKDTIVAFEQGMALYNRLPEPKTLIKTDVPHIHTLTDLRYQESVIRFLNSNSSR